MSGQENKNFRIIIEVFNDAENKWKRIRELTGNGGVSLLSQEDVDTDLLDPNTVVLQEGNEEVNAIGLIMYGEIVQTSNIGSAKMLDKETMTEGLVLATNNTLVVPKYNFPGMGNVTRCVKSKLIGLSKKGRKPPNLWRSVGNGIKLGGEATQFTVRLAQQEILKAQTLESITSITAPVDTKNGDEPPIQIPSSTPNYLAFQVSPGALRDPQIQESSNTHNDPQIQEPLDIPNDSPIQEPSNATDESQTEEPTSTLNEPQIQGPSSPSSESQNQEPSSAQNEYQVQDTSNIPNDSANQAPASVIKNSKVPNRSTTISSKESVVCDLCSRSYKNLGSLTRHKAEAHEKRNYVSCPTCSRTFSRNYMLIKHTKQCQNK